MTTSDLTIRARRVVFEDHVAPASVHIHNGRITSVGPFEDTGNSTEVFDVNDGSVLMPGLVDTHVHINAPGRSEWEGFESATKAAAAGGVTTLIDMPLNSIPPTTSMLGLEAKLKAAENKCHVDIGFWAGVVPGNTNQLTPLYRAGVVGFKCFLVPSGVDEFPHVTENDLREAMPELTRLGAMLIVHAELPEPIEHAATDHGAVDEYATFLHSRPKEAENDAIDLMIRLSREFGTRVHIVHLSSADAIPAIHNAQAKGVNITAETCPHYLHFAAEHIPPGATEFKCCPPIREGQNREKLWKGLAEGTIGFIVSDHSPCPESMKRHDTGNFLDAWGGIASLQLRLPVIWTEARERGFTFVDLARWLSSGPAEQVRFQNRKGKIAEGFDADLIVWNPDQEFPVDATKLFHRHKICPYDGEHLSGVVQKTFLRGRKIYDGLEIDEPAGGMFLLN